MELLRWLMVAPVCDCNLRARASIRPEIRRLAVTRKHQRLVSSTGVTALYPHRGGTNVSHRGGVCGRCGPKLSPAAYAPAIQHRAEEAVAHQELVAGEH